MLTGVVVSGLVLGAASLMTDIPGSGQPEAVALGVPAGSEFDRAREDREADLPRAEDGVEPGQVPKVDAPAPDDLSSLEGADTDPAERPVTSEDTDGLSAPGAGAADSGLDPGSDTPVLPSPQAEEPSIPEDEAAPDISTDPAQPAAPEVTPEVSAFGETEPDPPRDPEEDAAGTGEDAPDRDVADAPAPAATAPDESDAAGAAMQAETSGDEGGATDVVTDRLPTVGENPAEGAGAARDESSRRPAIEVNAAPFENPEGKPLMSIILIDNGDSPIGFEALESFPYPLSFAVDASWDGAKAAARRYREAGFEVLVMANLPEGAAAADAEVAMQTVLDAVPGAVAVMEGTDSGLQSTREAAGQLAPILLDTGHGLVLLPEGLDTARKLAEREGVPAATVFRDFDSKGQDATVIRRFLDQAAFKARQEEDGIVMLGRLRADTVSALLLWGLQDRAASVALAPVSAVLRAGN